MDGSLEHGVGGCWIKEAVAGMNGAGKGARIWGIAVRFFLLAKKIQDNPQTLHLCQCVFLLHFQIS